MNTDLLRTFVEVAKTRHFGHAAENLYLTQSAVSSRIRQLEETVGLPLFTRQRNNILLTPGGERLLAHAENILVAWQVALQETGVPNEQSVHMTLGGTPNLWDTFLHAALPKLSNEFPNLYMRTEVGSSQELTRALLAGRADVICAFDPPNNTDVAYEKIGAIELVMVSNRSAVSVADIREVGLVFVDWGTNFNLQQARLFSEPVAPILHTGQTHLALEFMLSRGGAAYLPKTMVKPYIDQRFLHPIDDAESVSQDLHIVYLKNSAKQQHLAPVIDMLKKIDFV